MFILVIPTFWNYHCEFSSIWKSFSTSVNDITHAGEISLAEAISFVSAVRVRSLFTNTCRGIRICMSSERSKSLLWFTKKKVMWKKIVHSPFSSITCSQSAVSIFQEAIHSFVSRTIGWLRARDPICGRWHAKGVHVDSSSVERFALNLAFLRD